MKRLLIATAALALIGAGTAVAQPTPSTDTPTTSSTTGDTTAQASTMPTTGTTMVGDMSASNPPPAAGSYPPCKRKGQDRCVVTAQMKHHTATRSGV